MKIYFAGSIRGGRADAGIYKVMIDYMKQKAQVLTEHVGYSDLILFEQGISQDRIIYSQDTSWLMEADILVAECTNPSLGVGYELCYAENLGIPCYVFYRKKDAELSALIKGNPYFTVIPYETTDELFEKLDEIMEDY
ncbi:MAG: nucleoside 2-deoxyribosyltransferase [Lachnospiraceae bacterium]|nr:nucleoside 2-deoxyribosyltransferase [Lachnospiraceae bacterium]